MGKNAFVHPYIPNSVPEIREAMLREIGVDDVEALFAEIPPHLRFRGRLDIPEPIRSEAGIQRHVEQILSKNKTCREYLNFLGAGCWQHHVPAVVDEIIGRSEFLTAYCGATYSDHGKYQARFEFNSLMGELLNMDAVANPIYDWGHAAGIALRMASRITGHNRVLVSGSTGPERLAQIRNLLQPEVMPTRIAMVTVDCDAKTGLLDMKDLRRKMSQETAAVYIENPSYWGIIEHQGQAISRVAHDHGAIFIVGTDPVSLGILSPPADYGADIACGDLQALGIHMNAGGGQSGFLAFHDDVTYLSECPLELYTLMETEGHGRFAVAEMIAERTSYGCRDKGKDWVGTASGLWTVGAAVYLALMGPQGMKEIGETIISNARYARNLLGGIDGVRIPFSADTFKEFVVNFDGTGRTVSEINTCLREKKIFGGRDLSLEFPDLGSSALYCVTEIHTRQDIQQLAEAVREAIQ